MRRPSITCFIVGFVAICLIGAANPETKCARCGTVCPCKKMCRLVHEEKSVEVVCWGCKCEQFCVAGPGCPTCQHCKCICENCDEKKPSGVCSEPKRFIWKDWCPSFGEMHTRTKLMKKTELVKVPTYKWVVEDVCCECATQCQCCETVVTDAAPADKKAK